MIQSRVRNQLMLTMDSFKDKQSGSAVVEFVILAIPLFLPIIIYVSQFAELSNAEIKGRSLIREVVRAYVSSEDLGEAEEKSRLMLNFGAERLRFSPSEISGMKLSFLCSTSPCLMPGSRVRGDLEFNLIQSRRRIHVSAQEYVSPWQ